MVLPSTGRAADGADVGTPEVDPSSSAVATEPRRPLGEILVEQGGVTQNQVDTALEKQSEPGAQGRRLGELLMAGGAASESDIAGALAAQYGLRTINPLRDRPDPVTVVRIDQQTATDLDVLAVKTEAGKVVVAVADPTRPGLVGSLTAAIGDEVVVAVGVPSVLAKVRDEAYTAAEGLGDIIRAFEVRTAANVATETAPATQIDENAPVVQVVSRIIDRAVSDRASDVHIEPMESRVRVRNRIDGALTEVMSLPSSMAQALASRIKIMAGLNIVERRRPQDGQIETESNGRTLDIRVSTAGTMFGESVVMRILDRERALYGLVDLGMPAVIERRYRDIIQSPYGLVVCAGPTGSGKTTTLYTTLQAVKSDEINVMTVEDPVEYVFPDINQMSINEVAGLTFASGLRAILRQDPDTILVGEIRDPETARIAIQAALTGHFVLSTVHATDASSAMHRFVDMGIESFLLASSLLATVGQRLVRQVCSTCTEEYEPTTEERAFYDRAGGTKDTFRRGAGCATCSGTGYLGRQGVYEVLRMTDTMRELVIENAQADQIRKAAIEDGMVPMQAQAIDLVDDGSTTIAEVMRTVYVL